jgi:DNA-binding transcriptional regulator YdaS (Cro superfamily)
VAGDPDVQDTYRSAMTYAIQIAGSDERLAELLKASVRQVNDWAAGAEPITDEVFLRAIDVVVRASKDAIRAARSRLDRLKPD